MDAEKRSVDSRGASKDGGRLSGEKTLAGSVSKSLRIKGWASRARVLRRLRASIRLSPDPE
jgi:hypothetical protein